MNRRAAGLPLFDHPGDFDAFERVLAEARARFGTRVCAYCLMGTHWHLVLWPHADGQLSEFVPWVSMTHGQRWHAHRHSAGTGHIDQSRFKSFPIASDAHFLRVCRYLERNPLRAGLVTRPEAWRWCSLACGADPRRAAELLDPWPVGRGGPPTDWLDRIRTPQTGEELEAIRRCVARGQPYGPAAWVGQTATKPGLESSLRPRGRPRKTPPG